MGKLWVRGVAKVWDACLKWLPSNSRPKVQQISCRRKNHLGYSLQLRQMWDSLDRRRCRVMEQQITDQLVHSNLMYRH